MSQEEVVRTSILSKSWRYVWCTRNLNNLILRHVRLPLDHFSSCRFPSLDNLALLFCDGLEESELFIDASNIKTFGYIHESVIPISISFATTSREWSSTLYLQFVDAPSSWLLKLHRLLTSLSRSEISLNIDQLRMNREHIFQENLDLVRDMKDNCRNNPAVVLEKLKITLGNLSYFSLLSNGLFCICRPRHMGQINYNYMNSEPVLKNLMQRESGNQHQLRQLWFRDLEEVSLEIYDKNQREWHPTSLADLPDNEQGKHIHTRFALKWRENSCVFVSS